MPVMENALVTRRIGSPALREASLADVVIRRSSHAIKACLANIATVPTGHPIREGRDPVPPLTLSAREPMTDLGFFGASFASGFVIFFGMIV